MDLAVDASEMTYTARLNDIADQVWRLENELEKYENTLRRLRALPDQDFRALWPLLTLQTLGTLNSIDRTLLPPSMRQGFQTCMQGLDPERAPRPYENSASELRAEAQNWLDQWTGRSHLAVLRPTSDRPLENRIRQRALERFVLAIVLGGCVAILIATIAESLLPANIANAVGRTVSAVGALMVVAVAGLIGFDIRTMRLRW